MGNYKITELFCYVVTGDDGDEGVPAFAYQGVAMPMMGADLARMRSLRQIADQIEVDTTKQVRLYKFTTKEEIDWRTT